MTAKKTEAPEAPDETTIATMAARIAELEAENERFQAAKAAAVAAPQAQDTQRKNNTEKLVQLTRSGNVRTTIDPTAEFMLEHGLVGTLDTPNQGSKS